ERNKVSQEIGQIKKEGGNADEAVTAMRKKGEEIQTLESKVNSLNEKIQDLLLELPNIPHGTVPVGTGEGKNEIVREPKSPFELNFTPKTHTDLGQSLNILALEQGASMSGSGFPIYLGQGARLERALINFMLDHHVTKHDYTEIFPPFLVREDALVTTGQLPKFEEDMYRLKDDDLFLIPTAEVPVTNLHSGEIINENDLPLYYAAYTGCFRREAGSYGKETRGLLRLHQFNKVELVKFVTPESSYKEHESLTRQAEEILQLLELPYRVVNLCTGDLGFSAAKCYDLEVWAPGEKQWLEVSSCSNFEAFQARRGNIRYRRSSDQKVDFVHTLNGSGLATPRLMVALLENYQKEDGTVSIPEPLQHYFGSATLRI
ncbi:MAG: serine--tRNA ligase, partial [SAR324 cluster bacterium]|nr:serine--tRNA ligase [SAR324 cluster bacterium]